MLISNQSAAPIAELLLTHSEVVVLSSAGQNGKRQTGRLHFEGGFIEACLSRQNDQTLSQGFSLVPIPPLARNAHSWRRATRYFAAFVVQNKEGQLACRLQTKRTSAPLFSESLLIGSLKADKILLRVFQLMAR